jgi:acetyl esterase
LKQLHHPLLVLVGACSVFAPFPLFPRESLAPLSNITSQQEPRAFIYREIDGRKLEAFVFFPRRSPGTGEPTAAVLLFHGGGWAAGGADWTFTSARRYAALGLLAVSVDYRLSDDKVTPIEALDDTRAAFRWVRRHADEFNIDPKRVAGDGVSAGGHLVAAAATIEDAGDGIDGTSAKPDLLLLWSPALGVEHDRWFIKLLAGRGEASDFSPLIHAGSSTPPACIVHGEKDTLTPLRYSEQFRDRVVEAGGVCELHVYPNVGHLLTRNLADQEDNYDPDPRFKADGIARQESFLRSRGYIR